ncbi:MULTISPECIES: mycofactocin-coupled SDR family oxidoreductase [unclassified Mycolicibacterium]|uniref:mycofactocin-coupled SDR family oxidoreductase n=1 Tax=unclassified Mycolicibacterium TaxID=2636767 RepID=UPI002ED9C568
MHGVGRVPHKITVRLRAARSVNEERTAVSQNGRFEGRVAFITGGARGQGAGLARRFAEEGADIVISDIAKQIDTIPYPLASPDDLAAVRAEVEAVGRRCIADIVDVREQGQLDELVAKTLDTFGRIDIVCPNAGITGAIAPFWEMTESQWSDMIAVNLTGVWHTVKAIAPTMISQQSGVIIFTGSLNTHEPLMNYCNYVASKHGVGGLAKSAALELGPHNVRVNTILPGPVNSPMINNPVMNEFIAGFEGATGDDMLKASRAWSLLAGRGAIPIRAVADAVLFLASDAADHIHGAELLIDSGHMVMPPINANPVVD